MNRDRDPARSWRGSTPRKGTSKRKPADGTKKVHSAGSLTLQSPDWIRGKGCPSGEPLIPRKCVRNKKPAARVTCATGFSVNKLSKIAYAGQARPTLNRWVSSPCQRKLFFHEFSFEFVFLALGIKAMFVPFLFTLQGVRLLRVRQ